MRTLSLVFCFLLSCAACAQPLSPEKYQEGVHYKTLAQPVKTITPGKIEVTEAFSYFCGHCYNFEPLLLKWEQNAPDDVEVVKLPVIWRKQMQVPARVMYTGKILNKYEDVNARVFKAVHKEGNKLASQADIAKLFKELGVDEKAFNETFSSFGVDSMVKLAEARTRSMQITGTPQLIVDGRYSVSATKDLSHEGMLKVVDFLIEKVRAEKG